MQDYFHRLADALTAALRGGEVLTSRFSSEDSDFVRFNHNQIRQAGHVTQRELFIDLIGGQRHAAGTLTLAGELDEDRARAAALIADLRERYQSLAEDPHLLYATEVHSTARQGADRLPDPTAAVADIQKAGQGCDLVGLYAAGGIHAGFANSLGQRNWYSTHSFNFDWSFYHAADKAVKTSYAGFDWDARQFEPKVAWAREQLAVLGKPSCTIAPGRYRIYLTPVAVTDLVNMLSWGGFGLKAQRTRQTPLLRMLAGEARFSPAVTLLENTRDGVAPNFQEAGFLRPDQVPLIRAGGFGECLVSPRSAKEYGVPTNGAAAHESPESLEMGAGSVPMHEALRRLDTGIYVSNLWYLNYSDRNACRTTGMTRFATLWVQHGQVQGPLNVMRFDETMYRALGENLAGLTAERELLFDSNTYERRSTSSFRMPGALIEDFTFTL